MSIADPELGETPAGNLGRAAHPTLLPELDVAPPRRIEGARGGVRIDVVPSGARRVP